MKRVSPVRERLLTTAQKLFVQRGYDRVSVRDITSRARANLGAVTYYFGSKKALYHAAIQTAAAPALEVIARAAGAPGSGLDRVEAITRAFLKLVTLEPAAPTALLRELASDRPLAPPVVQVMRRNVGEVTEAIAAGQRDGSIRAGNPLHMALSVVSQPFFLRVAGRIVQEALGIDGRNPKTRTLLVDQIAENVRRALTAAREPKAR